MGHELVYLGIYECFRFICIPILDIMPVPPINALVFPQLHARESHIIKQGSREKHEATSYSRGPVIHVLQIARGLRSTCRDSYGEHKEDDHVTLPLQASQAPSLKIVFNLKQNFVWLRSQ